jgi:hypothetical protein
VRYLVSLRGKFLALFVLLMLPFVWSSLRATDQLATLDKVAQNNHANTVDPFAAALVAQPARTSPA